MTIIWWLLAAALSLSAGQQPDAPMARGAAVWLDLLTWAAHGQARAGDFDRALATITQAHDDARAWAMPAATRAALLVERGRLRLYLYEWDAVLDDYTEALAIDANYAPAYYYRGLLYYTTLVERERALPDFERYLMLDPDGPHAASALQYRDAIRAELAALER